MEILVPQGKGALSFIPRTVEAPLSCLQHETVKDQRQTLHAHPPCLTALGSGPEGGLILPPWLHRLPSMELGWGAPARVGPGQPLCGSSPVLVLPEGEPWEVAADGVGRRERKARPAHGHTSCVIAGAELWRLLHLEGGSQAC